MKVFEQYGVGNTTLNTTREFLCSLECELEQVRNGGEHFGNFKCDKDGSLRNHGYEYITSVPRTRKQMVEDFKTLHEHLTFYDKETPFSDRTSTHVHFNICSLELCQVKTLLLLYALFEEFFFSMVKPARRDNIHCVPLTDTHIPANYSKEITALHSSWHKYTAFNLKRMADLGTIEFRHLHGTGDAAEVDTWLHVLENLWKLCQRVDVNAETLKDKAQIESWFEAIFFPADKVMMLKPSLFDIIKNSVIDVKFSTLV